MAASVTIPSVRNRTGPGQYRLEEIEQRLRSDGRIDGVTKHDLPTPCLMVDLDLMEGNIEKMAAHAKTHSIGLRPHAKTHKCPQIARRQIDAGALGICTATIREAEVMALGNLYCDHQGSRSHGAAGISGLLITSELVGPNKVWSDRKGNCGVKNMAASVTIPSVRNRTGPGQYRLEEIEQRLRSDGRIDGVTKHDLPTPCLMVDLDLMEGNIEKMAAHQDPFHRSAPSRQDPQMPSDCSQTDRRWGAGNLYCDHQGSRSHGSGRYQWPADHL